MWNTREEDLSSAWKTYECVVLRDNLSGAPKIFCGAHQCYSLKKVNLESCRRQKTTLVLCDMLKNQFDRFAFPPSRPRCTCLLSGFLPKHNRNNQNVFWRLHNWHIEVSLDISGKVNVTIIKSVLFPVKYCKWKQEIMIVRAAGEIAG